MTTIAIVGGGRAATLHAEAARLVRGVEIVGVGGRTPGTGSLLAEAVGAPDLALAELIRRAEAVVVAVPPSEVDAVLSQIPAEFPTLVESPVGPELRPGAGAAIAGRPATLTGANLVHAPVVARGLRAIGDMDLAHHLILRVRTPRPQAHTSLVSVASGVLFDPGARVLPVLLAAAGMPVSAVAATLRHTAHGVAEHADVRLRLNDERVISASISWADGPPIADLEAAGEQGVVALDLWPQPMLEVDGRVVADSGPDNPLVALGFVAQIERLVEVARHSSVPWPSAAVGVGVLRIAATAMDAAGTGGFLRPQ